MRPITKIHAAAGALALGLIATFWSSTLIAELFLDAAAIAAVKQAILWAIALLVAALATVGATGFRLAGKSTARIISVKRKRMPFIAANGLLVLLPSAFYLAAKAATGEFDTMFYAVQTAELAAGLVNMTLLGLNFRDGRKMIAGRRRRNAATAA